MITKINLIEALGKSLANEEEFLVSYGEKLLADVSGSIDLSSEEKEKIKELLDFLLKDTERHKETLITTIQKIKKDGRNEF